MDYVIVVIREAVASKEMGRLIIAFITCFVLDNLLVIFLPIQPIVAHYMVIPNVFLICLSFFHFL